LPDTEKRSESVRLFEASGTESDSGKVQALPDGISEGNRYGWITDVEAALAVLVERPEGLVIEAASRAWLELVGSSAEAALGRQLQDVALTQPSLLLANAVRQAMDTGRPVQFRGAIRAKDQETAMTVRPALGHARAVVVEARSAEPGLPPREGASDELLRRVVGASALMTSALMNGGIYYLYELGEEEPDLSQILGYPPGRTAAGQGILRGLVHPDDLAQVRAHRERVARSRDDEFSVLICRMRHVDGDWRWIEARERVATRDKEGAAHRILGFALDASERHRLLESLAAASKALLVAESHERKRIARELHDSMAQHLVAIDLLLLRLEQQLQGRPGQLQIHAEIREALRAAHSEVRTFSYLLHPPDLERLGFESSLRKFLQGFGVRTGLKVRFRVQGAARAIQGDRELALFRVAQEAMMNVHTHAGAQNVEVILTYSPEVVMIEVGDDGVGLSHDQIETLVAQQWGGVGVAGMTARMQQLGGQLEICAQPRGLLVRARLPLSDMAQGARRI
jgi:signal transduction histidine kinase